MSDPTYPAFPILSLLGSALTLIPLPWHLQAWNSGTCLYMIWASIACFNLGLNSILWRDNAINFAPIWCDISSRIIVATAVAIPAASLCINRRLYCIATIKTVGITRAEKRKAILVDLSIGLGIPLIQVLFQYIVSGHNYDIYEEIGCYPFTYNTPPAYPLSILWPLVIGMIAAVYCTLTLRAFLRRRAEFHEFLSSNTMLTPHRYFRLMALATVELCCTIPISGYGLYLNLSAAPMSPWISWSDTHWGYSAVHQYPAIIWRMDRNSIVAFELSRWAAPFCALVFFAFFGFADEARRNYAKALSLIVGQLPPWARPKAAEKSKLGFQTSFPSLSRFGERLPPYSLDTPITSSGLYTLSIASLEKQLTSPASPFNEKEQGCQSNLEVV